MVHAPVASQIRAVSRGAFVASRPPATSTLPLLSAVTVAPCRASGATLFSADHEPCTTVTLICGAVAAAVPAAFATFNVYSVVVTGATWTSTFGLRFVYLDPSLPVIVAVPATTAPPKLKSGVSVVDAPPWIIEDPAVRVVAVASGTTFTVTVDVATGPAVGTTVSVHVNVLFTFAVTVTFPPLEIDVAPSVPLHEAVGK